jgi:hypothetical protein
VGEQEGRLAASQGAPPLEEREIDAVCLRAMLLRVSTSAHLLSLPRSGPCVLNRGWICQLSQDEFLRDFNHLDIVLGRFQSSNRNAG